MATNNPYNLPPRAPVEAAPNQIKIKRHYLNEKGQRTGNFKVFGARKGYQYQAGKVFIDNDGNRFVESPEEQSLPQQIATGAAPSMLGAGASALGAAGQNQSGRAAEMGMTQGVGNVLRAAANVTAQNVEAKYPGKKMGAVGAGAMTTGADQAGTAMTQEMSRTGDVASTARAGLGALLHGTVAGAAEAVPGGSLVGNFLGGAVGGLLGSGGDWGEALASGSQRLMNTQDVGQQAANLLSPSAVRDYSRGTYGQNVPSLEDQMRADNAAHATLLQQRALASGQTYTPADQLQDEQLRPVSAQEGGITGQDDAFEQNALIAQRQRQGESITDERQGTEPETNLTPDQLHAEDTNAEYPEPQTQEEPAQMSDEQRAQQEIPQQAGPAGQPPAAQQPAGQPAQQAAQQPAAQQPAAQGAQPPGTNRDLRYANVGEEVGARGAEFAGGVEGRQAGGAALGANPAAAGPNVDQVAQAVRAGGAPALVGAGLPAQLGMPAPQGAAAPGLLPAGAPAPQPIAAAPAPQQQPANIPVAPAMPAAAQQPQPMAAPAAPPAPIVPPAAAAAPPAAPVRIPALPVRAQEAPVRRELPPYIPGEPFRVVDVQPGPAQAGEAAPRARRPRAVSPPPVMTQADRYRYRRPPPPPEPSREFVGAQDARAIRMLLLKGDARTARENRELAAYQQFYSEPRTREGAYQPPTVERQDFWRNRLTQERALEFLTDPNLARMVATNEIPYAIWRIEQELRHGRLTLGQRETNLLIRNRNQLLGAARNIGIKPPVWFSRGLTPPDIERPAPVVPAELAASRDIQAGDLDTYYDPATASVADSEKEGRRLDALLEKEKNIPASRPNGMIEERARQLNVPESQAAALMPTSFYLDNPDNAGKYAQVKAPDGTPALTGDRADFFDRRNQFEGPNGQRYVLTPFGPVRAFDVEGKVGSDNPQYMSLLLTLQTSIRSGDEDGARELYDMIPRENRGIHATETMQVRSHGQILGQMLRHMRNNALNPEYSENRLHEEFQEAKKHFLSIPLAQLDERPEDSRLTLREMFAALEAHHYLGVHERIRNEGMAAAARRAIRGRNYSKGYYLTHPEETATSPTQAFALTPFDEDFDTGLNEQEERHTVEEYLSPAALEVYDRGNAAVQQALFKEAVDERNRALKGDEELFQTKRREREQLDQDRREQARLRAQETEERAKEERIARLQANRQVAAQEMNERMERFEAEHMADLTRREQLADNYQPPDAELNERVRKVNERREGEFKVFKDRIDAIDEELSRLTGEPVQKRPYGLAGLPYPATPDLAPKRQPKLEIPLPNEPSPHFGLDYPMMRFDIEDRDMYFAPSRRTFKLPFDRPHRYDVLPFFKDLMERASPHIERVVRHTAPFLRDADQRVRDTVTYMDLRLRTNLEKFLVRETFPFIRNLTDNELRGVARWTQTNEPTAVNRALENVIRKEQQLRNRRI